MPRKIRSGKEAVPQRKYTRNEIILYVLGVIVVISMVCGTIASAFGS